MMGIISFVIYMMIHTGASQDIIPVSNTLYLGDEVSAVTTPTQALSYIVSFCPQGLNGDDIAVLDCYLVNNIGWDLNQGYAVVQVSKCPGSWSQPCVVAANYNWNGGAGVTAVSSISWKIDPTRNTSDYFIRVMAQNALTPLSMEISFTNNINATAYPWTADHPFESSTTPTPPQYMAQYWKSRAVYTVNNGNTTIFKMGYCHQGNTVKQVDIAIAAIPDTEDYSLMQVWACPQTVSEPEKCTYNYAMSGYGWLNRKIGSFVFLPCTEGVPSTTTKGLFIVVKGWGANKDKTNKLTLSASLQ